MNLVKSKRHSQNLLKAAGSAKTRGQSLVELGAGLMLLIPLMLAIFDASVVVIGVSNNDAICRDAARAAAAGRPVNFTDGSGALQTENARARAHAVADRASAGMKGYISKVQVIDEKTGPTPPTPTGPDPTFGGQYYGTYTVTTQVTINLPAALPNITPNPLLMRSSQTFPITFVEANIANP